MKILYAAARRLGAIPQLNRILPALEDHTVKIAAYTTGDCICPVDWTLDALLPILDPTIPRFDSHNFAIYCQQVEAFAPDLIISDLEPFTSLVAMELGIEIWQLSSILLIRGIDEGYPLGIQKQYWATIEGRYDYRDWLNNVLFNADRKLIYSHFGDLGQLPTLKEGFEWVRPYHPIGKVSIPCQHNLIAISPNNDKILLEALKKYPDAVVFSNHPEEQYSNLLSKDLNNSTEYACNLRNAQLCVLDGQATYLADAFYNGQCPYIYPDFRDRESIINFAVSERLKTGSVIYDLTKPLEPKSSLPMTYQPNISLLHQLI